MCARKKTVSIKNLRNIIITLLIAVCLIYGIASITFANTNPGSPDVIVTVDRNGQSSQEGNLFGNDIWYPGYEKSGTIRLSSTGGLTISKIDLDLSLNSFKAGYNEQTVYDSFMNYMRLTVKKGHLLVFTSTIIDDMTLSQVVSGDGIVLSGLDRLLISAGGFTDLEYTLKMDQDAGKELQQVSANLAFQINMNENPVPSNPPTSKPGDNEGIQDHWAHDCIETLLKYKIIEPYDDGTIRPENFITRAETAVLLGKALKLKDKTDGTLIYIDPVPDWARGYIISTTEAGVFKGYPGKLFKADDNIPREQMAAVLIRAFKKGLLANHDLNFTDTNKISKWAVEDVKAAVENQIIVGYPDRSFRPKDYMTRAEAFTIICKLLGYHTEH